MIDLRAPATPTSPERIRERLSRALGHHDRATARRIFYAEVVPNRQFPEDEVAYLAGRVGAIDEGDDYLATREDL